MQSVSDTISTYLDSSSQVEMGLRNDHSWGKELEDKDKGRRIKETVI